MQGNNQKLYSSPLLVKTAMMPEDVYGQQEMGTLKKFLLATLSCRSLDAFNSAVKGYSDMDRGKIAGMLQEIRECGYYPDHIDEHGNVCWGAAVKSDVQMAFEKKLKEKMMSEDQG